MANCNSYGLIEIQNELLTDVEVCRFLCTHRGAELLVGKKTLWRSSNRVTNVTTQAYKIDSSAQQSSCERFFVGTPEKLS